MKNILIILISFLSTFILLESCGTTNNQSNRTATSRIERKTNDTTYIEITQPLSLADFLMRVPGIIVRGNQVSIRGGGPPLYVIDGTRLGHSYEAANSAVSVNDIESVQVLKSPSELAMYGIDGKNGVILIRTKRQ